MLRIGLLTSGGDCQALKRSDARSHQRAERQKR